MLAITSQPQRAGFPLTLRIRTGELPKESRVKISQVRTISTERLGERIGRLSQEELEKVVDGLFELVG